MSDRTRRYDVDAARLFALEGRVRVWLRQTVLARLLDALEDVNGALARLPPQGPVSTTLRVGDTTLDTLKVCTYLLIRYVQTTFELQESASRLCISGEDITLSARLFFLIKYLDYHPRAEPLPAAYTGREVQSHLILVGIIYHTIIETIAAA